MKRHDFHLIPTEVVLESKITELVGGFEDHEREVCEEHAARGRRAMRRH